MAGGSLADFKGAIERFRLQVNGRAKETTKKLARVIFRRIITRTPVVGSGRARASWNISLGSPDFSVVEEGAKFTQGGATQHALRSVGALAGFTGAEVIWIANGAPYITQLECGSSKRAPQGMVAITLAEVEARRELAAQEGEGDE